MFQKRLWKSDILIKDGGRCPASLLPQVFFKNLASKNQLSGLPVSGTLVQNGLNFHADVITLKLVFLKTPFLDEQFSYYTKMTFLMMIRYL